MIATKFDYKCSAIDHWERCKRFIEQSQDICEYFYAALELRFCIERICFEYLILAKERDGGPSKGQMNQYTPRRLLKSVFDCQEKLDRHCDFMNTIFELAGKQEFQMNSPSIEWLNKVHGKLGLHLHAIRREPNLEQFEELRTLVEEEHLALTKYLRPRADFSNMRPNTQSIYEAYLSGALNSDSMKKRLQLSNIPIPLLNPRRPN